MKGRIKYYNKERGFGFIIGEDNKDYYMHISNVKSFQLPEQGRPVEFTESSNEKGPCAIDIFVLENKKTSSVIILGNVRIKKRNIKNYGITKREYPYKKIYEYEKRSGKLERFLFGDLDYVWNGKVEKLSEEEYIDLYNEYFVVEDSMTEPPYVMKEVDCLYITTYQNDNYIFRQDDSDFDIYGKCAELDSYFS